MKIALINIIKPQEGSRDGMTEYAYQLFERLRRKHRVDLVYVTETPRRYDISVLLKANTSFKPRIRRLAKLDYDIVHITNQELGYAAKLLKKSGSGAGIVTSIHDLMRTNIHAHKSLTQKAYNVLVRGSILDSFKYSDYLIFSASTVQNDAVARFGGMFTNYTTTLLGPSEEFRTTPIPKKNKKKKFLIATVGAFVPWKNQIFVLRTAKLLKGEKSLRFRLIGHGPDEGKLRAYIRENKLDNVEIVPFPAQDKFLQMYDGFDMMFYPTTEEGSSLPMINAQCRGLPVVIYKGNRVDVEVTRYCLAAKNEEDAAAIIMRIKRKGFDRKHRDAMVKYVRAFSWDRVAMETLDVYKRVLTH